ncbi:hypothetical protein [uncultured Sphingomonas sp.]|uniref:hypothetical protein n=1 Tax=uncultured Sphingomonas sp. TaxID=158754 RepID=UPI0025DA0D3D|nr:hypothetical protein [uncultured Sphingomonas sp.]
MIFDGPTALAQLADRVETLVMPANDDDQTWREVEAAVQRHVGTDDHTREYLSSWDDACSLILPGWRLVLAGMGSEWTAGLGSQGRMVGASAPSAPQAIVAAAIRSRLGGEGPDAGA